MNELSQSGHQYVDEHPNAIVDKEKAEFVAHAAKEEEEAVVALSNKALEEIQGGRFGERPEGTSIHVESARKASTSMDEASDARKRADDRINNAAIIFDAAKELKSGKKLTVDVITQMGDKKNETQAAADRPS